MIKPYYFPIALIQCLLLSSCKEKAKQIEYTETIEAQLFKIELLISENGNTIDNNNIPALHSAWLIVSDNATALEQVDTKHPCDEPDCVRAVRVAKGHLGKVVDKIKNAKKDQWLVLDEIFPM